MGTKSTLSADQYLRTSYPELDREFRDGDVVERSLPTYLHGKTKASVMALFAVLPKTLFLHVCAETRMKLRENLNLIPDVAVFRPDEPAEVPDSPPLVAIEVRSEDDRTADIDRKLEEYRAWGVPHAWLVDPYSKRFYARDGALLETDSLRIPDLDVGLTRSDVFD